MLWDELFQHAHRKNKEKNKEKGEIYDSANRWREINMQDKPVSIQRPVKPPLVNLVTTGDNQSLPRPDEKKFERKPATNEGKHILTTTAKGIPFSNVF